MLSAEDLRLTIIVQCGVAAAAAAVAAAVVTVAGRFHGHAGHAVIFLRAGV